MRLAVQVCDATMNHRWREADHQIYISKKNRSLYTGIFLKIGYPKHTRDKTSNIKALVKIIFLAAITFLLYSTQ